MITLVVSNEAEEMFKVVDETVQEIME